MRQLFILLVLIVFSCDTNKNSTPTINKSIDCEQLVTTVKQLKSEINSQYKGYIGHDIYLKLKNGEDQSKVIKALNSLGTIKGVEALKVGPFKNLGDKRALTYDVKMQMYFKDEKAYQHYNKDATHLEVRKQLGPMLDGPPASYDFIVE